LPLTDKSASFSCKPAFSAGESFSILEIVNGGGPSLAIENPNGSFGLISNRQIRALSRKKEDD
jgi:hypothetical protein